MLFVYPDWLVRRRVANTLQLRAVEEEIARPKFMSVFFPRPTGCVIRSLRNLNNDIANFTKFSLVYQSENEKPQSNFYILVKNAISTYHEFNLNWFWVIAHGKCQLKVCYEMRDLDFKLWVKVSRLPLVLN